MLATVCMEKKQRQLKPIDSLFDKYKKTLRAPQGSVVKEFVEIVEDILGIRIASDQVRYTVGTKTLSVSVSGPLKSEIKLREVEILTHLSGRLGPQSAPKTIL